MLVYPVIHFLNRELAIDQVSVARNAGASGVFLISHLGDDELLVKVAREAKQLHHGFPLGINLLSDSANRAVAYAIAGGLDMVWADSMGVDSRGLTPRGIDLSKLAKELAYAHPSVRLFASVAFKYQPIEHNPELAATNALAAGFIPTTSGAATGSAPSISKIRSMSEATGGQLAVASGMTPDNIADYAPLLSHVLVATGVALDEHRIDPGKLVRFIANARAHQAAKEGA